MKTNKINEMVPGDNASTSTTTTSTPLPTSSTTQKNPSINIPKKYIDADSKLIDKLVKPGSKVNINVIEEEVVEPEAIITPQDDATIKYLSNVRDINTGEISKPFTINDKNYQMVRGIKPSKEIVMAVFCHDELNESGENIIHPIEHFEKTIVQPMMEKEAKMQQEAMFGNDFEPERKPKVESNKENESLNLSEFKHYLVNEKSGKFRKFKNIVELAAAVMDKEEKYMPIKEFRKFFEERVFGGKPKKNEEVLNEFFDEEDAPATPQVGGTPADEDATILAKAKRLIKSMDEVPRVQKSLNYLAKSKNYKEKTQALTAFLERINIKPGDVPKYLNTVKTVGKEMKQAGATAPAATTTAPAAAPTTLAPVGVAERKVMTKAELTESLSQSKVIKTIKVKDIK